jgi:hypothetical protein
MGPAVGINREGAILLENAGRWTDAMERMGKEAVQAEMARRPAREGDRIFDIVHEPPFPTREFCQQWCTAQDNVVFRFSKTTAIILALIVLITGSLVQVFSTAGTVPRGAMSPAATASAARQTAAVPMMVDRQRLGTPSAPQYQPGTSTASSGNGSSSSMPSLIRPLMPSLAPTSSRSSAASGSSSSTMSNSALQP